MGMRSCALRNCCARYQKARGGKCSCKMEDILDCFIDSEYDGAFRLGSLIAMGD
ncbi:MAG: hypothetical protein ACUVV4_07895 [Candidatus Bathyarchaeia archaeon]